MTDKIITIALNISKTEGCQNCTVWIAKKIDFAMHYPLRNSMNTLGRFKIVRIHC